MVMKIANSLGATFLKNVPGFTVGLQTTIPLVPVHVEYVFLDWSMGSDMLG